MSFTVQLDNQRTFSAVKIDYIWTYSVLAAEFNAQLFIADTLPQYAFCGSEIAAEILA